MNVSGLTVRFYSDEMNRNVLIFIFFLNLLYCNLYQREYYINVITFNLFSLARFCFFFQCSIFLMHFCVVGQFTAMELS